MADAVRSEMRVLLVGQYGDGEDLRPAARDVVDPSPSSLAERCGKPRSAERSRFTADKGEGRLRTSRSSLGVRRSVRALPDALEGRDSGLGSKAGSRPCWRCDSNPVLIGSYSS